MWRRKQKQGWLGKRGRRGSRPSIRRKAGRNGKAEGAEKLVAGGFLDTCISTATFACVFKHDLLAVFLCLRPRLVGISFRLGFKHGSVHRRRKQREKKARKKERKQKKKKSTKNALGKGRRHLEIPFVQIFGGLLRHVVAWVICFVRSCFLAFCFLSFLVGLLCFVSRMQFVL